MALEVVIWSPVNTSSPQYGDHGCYDDKTSISDIFLKSVMTVFFA